MNDGALFLAVLLACAVEAVEATTIVLAAGTARSWRSALTGVIAALVVLAIAVGVAGPAISLLPLDALRLVVGGLLLVFGLQWIRKAVLRASGYKPLHDEEMIYKKQLEEARKAKSTARLGVDDWYAFTLSFKGVVLEGLEVVFIVLTFGTNQHNIPLAALAAGVAVVIVVILGVVVRAPLARVPENTLKFIVGIMLTSFGIFWGAEGAGAIWPGADLALLVIAPAIAVFSLAMVWVMSVRRRSAASEASAPVQPAEPVSTGGGTATMTQVDTKKQNLALARLKAFGLFWYDFVIGDDWQVAAGVALALALTFWISAAAGLSWILLPIAVVILLPYSVRRALR
ncbi:MAG: hypothetical protein JWR36_2327 [Glaciihabitans sp.]|jgi:uncharacterized membrane protein|nr:hypothetical protein [Glaciihabitans sp.]